MSEIATRLEELLRARRFRFVDEAQLQAAIASVLNEAGIPFVREAILSREERVDFLLEDGLALEVKVDGGVTAVVRQLGRYADLDSVREVVLVTTRAMHTQAPERLNGKPVTTIHLSGSAF